VSRMVNARRFVELWFSSSQMLRESMERVLFQFHNFGLLTSDSSSVC